MSGTLSVEPLNPQEAAAVTTAFEREIANQEDLLYGVALLFEGLNFLYAGQEEIITTYRKQLRNIIQMDRKALDDAQSLLEQAKRDPSKAALLLDYKFTPCQGHAQPLDLCRRAQLLVEAYAASFPGRPRSEALSPDEIVQLLKVASGKMEMSAARPE